MHYRLLLEILLISTLSQFSSDTNETQQTGANIVKKHQKPNPVKGTTGGIVEIEKPIHISNIAIYNATTKKADRVGVKQLEDGRKVRVFKSNGEVIA